MIRDKLAINYFPRLEYAVAEAMNTLWTNLSYSGSNMKTFAITSCRPDEGKTSVAMNLSRTIAETGKRVLIIDADLRKSVMAGRYRISSMSGEIWGLAHYLTGQCSIDQMLYETSIPNFDMILAGHEVINSFALLDTPYFPDLLKQLTADYDAVLIDTPPVGTIIDAAIIARHCDGTAMVVKYNTVSRKELAEARIQLEKVGARVLGAILNDVEIKAYGMKKYYYKAYYKYGDQNDGNDMRNSSKRKSKKNE
ncbi:MAG: CpsD/CapB family tyrosine-protein kinase [Christensenellales bacterium]